MKELIQSLVELQGALRAIGEAEQVELETPKRMEALDRQLEKAQGILEAARVELADDQKQRRHQEMEISSVESVIQRHQDQMMSVKTNEAYRALQHEIETERAKVRALEDGVLELMERAEELESRVKTLESETALERKRVEEEKQRLAASGRAAAGERERLQQVRKAIEQRIPANILENFHRIASARGGVGIVAAHDELCGGCNVRLRPQVFQEVRAGEELHSCGSCKRYLYCPEEPLGKGTGESEGAEEGHAPAGS